MSPTPEPTRGSRTEVRLGARAHKSRCPTNLAHGPPIRAAVQPNKPRISRLTRGPCTSKGAAPTPSDAHTRATANAGVASLVTSDVVFATSGSRQAVGLDLVDTVAADYRVHVKPGPADPGPAKSRSRSESARRSAPGLRGLHGRRRIRGADALW